MDIRDYLSDDGHAVLALCSAFALPEADSTGGAAPFTLSEWNQLARQIHESSWKRPAELQGQSVDEITKELAIASDQADRIAKLLERGGRLALELDSLFSRGMWALTRVDELYPARLRDTLKHQSPTVLFGAGEIHLLRRAGVAVIGSRNIDEAGAAFAKEVGRKTVAAGLPVVSGGARGTDRLAMDGAMEAEGSAIGVLADSLEATIRKSDVREFLIDGRLVLLTGYAPTAGFSVGAAMGRNKVIYGLSEFAVVVSSDFQTGGTWAGAVEALKGGWCPVFVREGADTPKGNHELVKKGGLPLPQGDLEKIGNLAEWMGERARPTPRELELFDAPSRPRTPG
jgi:DNA processing protein